MQCHVFHVTKKKTGKLVLQIENLFCQKEKRSNLVVGKGPVDPFKGTSLSVPNDTFTTHRPALLAEESVWVTLPLHLQNSAGKRYEVSAKTFHVSLNLQNKNHAQRVESRKKKASIPPRVWRMYTS